MVIELSTGDLAVNTVPISYQKTPPETPISDIQYLKMDSELERTFSVVQKYPSPSFWASSSETRKSR